VTATRRIRPPAVAGTFYPADPDELARGVDDALAAAALTAADLELPPPCALIAPHAGHRYSGPIAASAYVRLLPVAGSIRRVVLLGPAHRVGLRALGVSSADAWRTPLGDVPIDAELRARVLHDPAVEVHDRAHAPEHSLEVHLPFLQRVLAPGWSLLPLVVGRATPEQVSRVLDLVWDEPATLVVVSTDLSHYHPYDEAVRLDRATAAAIVAGRSDIEPTSACGAHPLCGLLRASGERGLDITLLDLRCSGDTFGDRREVVGYAAFALTPSEPPTGRVDEPAEACG
jgi:AmmeMemoRadiSam system protein B